MMRRRPIAPDLRDWIEIVVEHNADDLLRYLRRRTAAAEDAADLLGRVFLLLWENAAKVPTIDEQARMWCFGVARNVVREHTRHGVKQLRIADALRANLSDRGDDLGNDAAAAADAAITAGRVRAAVAALDDKSRELIMLIHWDGFSIAQAAAILSVNPSSARTRYSRAKDKLAAALPEMASRDSTQLPPGLATDPA